MVRFGRRAESPGRLSNGGPTASRIEELDRERNLREQILSSMPDGVLLVEPDGEAAYANPAARALLGPTLRLPAEAMTGGAREFTVHYPVRRDLRSVSARLEDGRTLVVIQDVTEAKRVDAMRRDFVADASHELKTPVAGILASAETLEVSSLDDPESVPQFTASLLKDARRLSILVDDLLDLARLEQYQEPSLERVSLSEVVEAESGRAQPAASKKELKLQANVAEEVEVLGSREDLALAVRNLLENAIAYTERGEARIALSSQNGQAVVEVTDTGVGIPERELARVFERFYRVDKARSRETGGTGLGLSIVRHVVERHGGEVWAKSTLGEGSLFAFSIPLAPGG